jgi:polar amino acid transport system substrate-binding protein
MRQRADPCSALSMLALRLFTALLLYSIAAAGIASSQPLTSHDLKSIVERGVLHVAVTPFNLPAFHWRSGETLAGPEIELARQLGRALGVEVKFVDKAESFDAVVDAVANGQADIGVSKLSQTYYRLMRVRFSDPYLTLRHALLYNRAAVAARANGQPPDTVLRQFRGRIGAIRDSAYVDFGRRNFHDAEIVEVPNWVVAVDQLVGRQLDAIYRDEFEIRRVLKNRPALNVQFGAAVISDQKAFLSVAICETCARLQEFINYHLVQTQGMFTLQGLLMSDLRD